MSGEVPKSLKQQSQEPINRQSEESAGYAEKQFELIRELSNNIDLKIKDIIWI